MFFPFISKYKVCIYFTFFSFVCLFVFAFYTEIQNGHQNWQENDFWGKSPVDSADTQWVKNFVEIALVHTVSEINEF